MLIVSLANTRGGKAGRGKNKTSTVRVMELGSGGFGRIMKQFRYKVADAAGYVVAFNKAQSFIRKYQQAEARKKFTGVAGFNYGLFKGESDEK
jgi:hypothetical protein